MARGLMVVGPQGFNMARFELLQLIGFLIGAAIITLLLTRIAKWLFQKALAPLASSLMAFFVVGVTTLVLGSRSLGFATTLLFYMPWLLLWVLIDVYRARRSLQKRDESREA